MDYDRLVALLEALEREGVRYVVFGAVALDLFVAPDAENIARLKKALQSVFADPEIEGISADDLLGDYPAVQCVPPDGSFHIDILTRLGTAFRFEDLDVARVPVGPIRVSVATPRTLSRMKRDTVRLKDRADAELLRQRFKIEDD